MDHPFITALPWIFIIWLGLILIFGKNPDNKEK